MKLQYLLLIICLSFYSCSKPSVLEHALLFSGDNQSELEKVLNYYNEKPEDSLKYKAACFLIENLPYHFYYEGESIERFKEAYQQVKKDGLLGQDAINQVVRNGVGINYSKLNRVKDAHKITAEFLIDNIEHSFMVWQKQPWGKDVTFDDFCEYILPYRIEDEPLENWKERYYNKYQPVLDSLLTTNKIEDASIIIYEYLTRDPWIFILNMPTPHLGADYLFSERSGSCRDRCDLAIYVMRSLGIPVGTDGVLHNPDNANRHFWSFLLNNDGSTSEFTLWEEPPVWGNTRNNWKKRGKVYRQTFSVQPKCVALITSRKEILSSLNSLKLKDVSNLYFESNKIAFQKQEIENRKNDILYLSVFNTSEWSPIDWGIAKEGDMQLNDVEPGVMYMLRNADHMVYYPFIIKGNEEKHYFIPDTNNMQTLQLNRKFTMKFMEEHMKRFTGGIFEASNNKDFKNATQLYKIDSISLPQFYTCSINENKKFQYIRYYSPDSSLCNMAELVFQNDKGETLTGQIIGTDGAWNNEARLMKQAVFDNDNLTFFNAAEPHGVWVGLALDKPQRINTIKYLPRNDDNFIREGDLYELFYFDRSWISLGEQIGTDSQILIYKNAPTNALFWLRNHTRGKEERIFTYEGGKQIWW